MRNIITLLTLMIAVTVAYGKEKEPLSLSWDLSGDNNISVVNWPATVPDDVWIIDGPGTIHVKTRGGFEHDMKFRLIQVGRKGKEMYSVRVLLPPGTAKEVYADAIKLADDWDFKKRAGIENFLKRYGDKNNDNPPSHGAAEPIGEQPRLMEIRQAFGGPGKEFYVLLSLGLSAPKAAPDATSQPAK